jgi:hypothetical protein
MGGLDSKTVHVIKAQTSARNIETAAKRFSFENWVGPSRSVVPLYLNHLLSIHFLGSGGRVKKRKGYPTKRLREGSEREVKDDMSRDDFPTMFGVLRMISPLRGRAS